MVAKPVSGPHHFIMRTQKEIKVVKITRYCSL